MLFYRVKELSEKRRESLKTVSKNLGLSENAIYKWKTQSPSTEILNAVADYFNVSTDYLLGRTDEKEIQTIAAHHDGDEWTEEELKTIEDFKRFVKSQRQNKE